MPSITEIAGEVIAKWKRDLTQVVKWERMQADIEQAIRDERERQWQPIETAPRDGTPILIAFPNGHVQQHILKPVHVKVVWFDSDPPDRWMPLPTAAKRTKANETEW